jgi:selenocysteine-specific elongation factor
MFVIGTAGHIDHGKSALVLALTGIDPDRLPEEKKRGMTIDLGFAWFSLSSGERIGIVDVPGHKDFISNVIPGVGGIDAALIVIAADDGWMPQTEEHLQILNFLDIKHGIVALTKVDVIDDPYWLDLTEEDIRRRLGGTRFSDVPIIRVSAREGTNIAELKRGIEELVSKMAPRRDIGKPRLPVDRVFTIKGSGTVVTGTLIDGCLSQGEKVVIFPKNLHTRIRALESYKEKTNRAQPGTRVALNLVGLEKKDVKRGDIIFEGEEQFRPSRILDTRVELISRLPNPLKNNAELVAYLGTREILGRIILFGAKALEQGESAFAQLRFKEPVATCIGDHFIIRKPSPAETIGGGTVLDPLASKHKFKDMDNVITFLQRRINLGIEELILTEVDKNKYMQEDDLLMASHYSSQEVRNCVRLLQDKNKLIAAGSWVIDLMHWRKQIDKALDILAREHSLHPLGKGFPQAVLQGRLDVPKQAFSELITTLTGSGKIVRYEDTIALSTHRPWLSPDQETAVSRILKLFEEHQPNPPTGGELAAQIPNSEEIVRFMCQQNMLIELPEGILLERKHYQNIKTEIINFLRSNGAISIQQVRALFGFSRKHILPLLSKLEEEKVIRRQGDIRVLVETQ